MLNRFSLRNLCVLCVSAVNLFVRFTHRRGAENAEITQRQIKTLLLLRLVALAIFAIPVFGQGTAIEPCPATPAPAKPVITASPEKVDVRAKLLVVDAGTPDDTDVEKMLAPYSVRVKELSKVIGRLEDDLNKTGAGAGSIGNFVTDGMKAQARKLGKPVVLAVANAGGLRKNEIAAGELMTSLELRLRDASNVTS